MKILGISVSFRRQGNTEVLVKEGLMAAEEAGAEVDFLRLTDYHIEECQGCGRCETGMQPCKINDDFNMILEQVYSSDGLILGTPCYYFSAPGILKIFLDRTVCEGYPSRLSGKPAAIVVTHANRGFTPYAFVVPDILLQKWNMNVISRILVQAASFGDAALDERVLSKMKNIGEQLVKAIKGEQVSYEGEGGICPVCHGRLLRVLKDMEVVECPTCGIRGTLTLEGSKIKVAFTEESVKRGRFSTEHWYRHHMYHVELGRDVFMRTKEIRKVKRAKYLNYLRKGDK